MKMIFSSQVWWCCRERKPWEISNRWRPLQTFRCPVYHWGGFWSFGGGRNQWLSLDLGNEAFRNKLDDSFYLAKILSTEQCNYSFQIKENPAFKKSQEYHIFQYSPTIYQHFLPVETKIFSYIKYFENAKNFVVIYKLYTLFRLDSFKNISTKSFIFIPSTLHWKVVVFDPLYIS